MTKPESPSQSELNLSRETVIYQPNVTQTPTAATTESERPRVENDGVDVEMKDPNLTDVTDVVESEVDHTMSRPASPDFDNSSMEVNYNDSE